MKKKVFLLMLTALVDFNASFGKTSNVDLVNAPARSKSEGVQLGNKNITKSSQGAFIENKGQIRSHDGSPRTDVKYVFTEGNTNIFLRQNGIAYQFTKKTYPAEQLKDEKKNDLCKGTQKADAIESRIKTETYRMDMSLVGANPNAKITTEGESKDYTNLCGLNIFRIRSYAKIIYQDIYPGINWIIYTEGTKVKYDFEVMAGADPSAIQLEFKHHESIHINEDGCLMITNRLGIITEKKPVSFVNGRAVGTNFTLEKNTVSFIFEEDVAGKPLVIDPSIIWSTYYGGTGFEQGNYTCTDASGNVYLAGETTSTVSIGAGGYQTTFGGGTYDAFIVKFNSAGVRQWASYYGGPGNNYARGCCVDALGNVFLSGQTSSTAGISSAGHQNSYGGGGWDAFLVKFDVNGVRQWATYYGGISYEDCGNCAVDASNNVYLVGSTDSNAGIASGGHQNSPGGNSEAFLAKFNSNGSRLWATFYGGTSSEQGKACTTDQTGNVFMCGSTNSSAGIAMSGHQNTLIGNDAYLVKFNSAGVRLWGTYYGGANGEIGNSCSCDGSGNIYLGGNTGSNSGIASGGFQNTYGVASQDAFLAKFNGLGVRQWATYYGQNGVTNGNSCVTDNAGNIYLAGMTTSSLGIAAGGYQNTFTTGTQPAYLVKFNTSGARQWGTYFAQYAWYPTAAADPGSNVYLASYNGQTVNIAFGGHQTTYGGGGGDAFLIKFCNNGPVNTGSILGNATICAGSQTYSVIPVPDASTYLWSLPVGWSGSSTTTAISVTPSANGILTVSASNGCGSSTGQTLAIVVNPAPTISLNVTNSVICEGSPVTITASGADTYTWSGGITNGVAFTPTSTASFTVTATNSVTGCSNTTGVSQSIFVNPLPTITVVSSETLYCPGMTVTLTASGANTYSWVGGGTGLTHTVSPLTTTSFSVVGTNSNNCNNTGIFTLIENQITAFNYTVNGMVVSLALNSNSCATFNWGFGNGTSSNSNPTPVVTYITPGTYGVCLKCDGIPSVCKKCFDITVPGNTIGGVGINELTRQSLLNLYPNPVLTEIFVELTVSGEATILNCLGQELTRTVLKEGKNTIDVRELPAGLLFVAINQSGIVTKYKVIKE